VKAAITLTGLGSIYPGTSFVMLTICQMRINTAITANDIQLRCLIKRPIIPPKKNALAENREGV
jgi:hypothetical protein